MQVIAGTSLGKRNTPVRLIAALVLMAACLPAAPKRILYFTYTAGFRHDSIPYSQQVFRDIAAGSQGALEVVASEDLSLISAAGLSGFDILWFFTSGELPLSDVQKADLLAWVRSGKGFGGVHSATDTLYNWSDYGDLIGAYFNGHPWAQEVAIDIEDPDHPAVRHLAPSFRISDEIYQFRNFSRDRVRVLMTLDTSSVDLTVADVNPGNDFPLAWCRSYGSGRVFYTALGHGEETWRDPRFQTMLSNALLWLAGLVEGDARPRSAAPAIAGVRDAAFAGNAAFAPGELVTIGGQELTTGSQMSAPSAPLPPRLAGTSVLVDGNPAPLLFVSPQQINLQLPFDLQDTISLRVSTAGHTSAPLNLMRAAAAPAIFTVVPSGAAISIYATGLGALQRAVPAGSAAPAALVETQVKPEVTIAGMPATVLFSGLAPGFVGLYQVNAMRPAGLPAGDAAVVLRAGGRDSNSATVRLQP